MLGIIGPTHVELKKRNDSEHIRVITYKFVVKLRYIISHEKKQRITDLLFLSVLDHHTIHWYHSYKHVLKPTPFYWNRLASPGEKMDAIVWQC